MSEAALRGIPSDYLGIIAKVSTIVHKISGNRLGEQQAHMVENRIKKRMIDLGIKQAADYSIYIDQNYESESVVLVGLMTTHHTFFFREFIHFEILKNKLPDIVAMAKKRGDKTLKIWSAACSRGQEVYSIAMFLEHYLSQIDPSMSYKILGTDIDLDSVNTAKNGVYHQNEIKEIPMNLLGNHWAKGTGDISMYAKVKSTLKSKCEFRTGNLLKIEDIVNTQKFDVIFCKNVFIYFESFQVEKMSRELIGHLFNEGILFSGISETLSGLKQDVSNVGPSAYMLKKPVAESRLTMVRAHESPPLNSSIEIYKVMCVDDSPIILTLLKKILTKDKGFEVVVTAVNGVDAMEKLKTHKVDLITLDIHMPEMDGVTYLEKNFNKFHPPVVIISSASRSDSDIAIKALRLGASDFVEKPALNNLEEQGEEIRTKLRSVAHDYNRKPVISSFDNENQQKFIIANPEKKSRVIYASISDFPRLKVFLNHLDNSQPSTIIFFEAHGEILEAIVNEHAKDFKMPVVFYNNAEIKTEPNKIYFSDFKTYFGVLSKKLAHHPSSLLVFGNVSGHSAKKIAEWKNAQLLIEDMGEKLNNGHPLKAFSTDVVPATSFAYMSCRYLSNK